MKRLSSYLKNRTVRLGLMAAFVVGFMGLPTLGYTQNVDALKKLDVFNLNENLYAAWICDASGYCAEYADSNYVPPDMTGTPPPTTTTTTPPPTTTTTTTTTTSGSTTTGTTTTTTDPVTGAPVVTDSGTSTTGTTTTWTDYATGQTYTYVEPVYVEDWSTYDWEDVNYEEWDPNAWEYVDYGTVDYTQTTTDFWTYFDPNAVDYGNAAPEMWDHMEYEFVDYSKAGNEFWMGFAENGDLSAVEGVWGRNEWSNYYMDGLQVTDPRTLSAEDQRRHYTATSEAANMYQDWSNTAWTGTSFGNDYWQGWSSNDQWSDFSFDETKGTFTGDNNEVYRPTDYGFLMDDSGKFFDDSGAEFSKEKKMGGLFHEFFKDESGNQFYPQGGELYPYEEGKGFPTEFGGKEFYSDYWFTGEFDFSEFDMWENHDWKEFEYNWESVEGYDQSWLEPMPPAQLEGELAMFEGSLEGFNPEANWTMLQKQSDYLADELQSTVDAHEEAVVRYEADGVDATALSDTVETLDTVLVSMQEFLSESEILKELQATDLTEVSEVVASLEEDATVVEVQTADLNLEKMECYDALIAMMDSQNEHLKVLGETTDVLETIGVIEQNYTVADLEIPSDVSEALSNYEGEMDTLLAYKETFGEMYEEAKALATELRTSTDPAFVEESLIALWDMAAGMEAAESEMTLAYEEFESEDPSEAIAKYETEVFLLAQVDDMAGEASMIKEQIEAAQGFIEVLETLDVEDPAVENAIAELGDLAEAGLNTLEQIETAASSDALVENPNEIVKLWGLMENLGFAAETHMGTVMEWIEENPEIASTLGGEQYEVLTGMQAEFEYQNQELDYTMLYENFGFEESDAWEDGAFEDLNEFDEVRFEMADAYPSITFDDSIEFDEFVAQINPEDVQTLTRVMPESIMLEVAVEMAELGGTAGEETLALALNSAEFIDTSLIDSTMNVFEVVDNISVEASQDELIREDPSLKLVLNQLEELHEETLSTFISESSEEELATIWEEARVLLEVGGEKSEFIAIVDGLEVALEENMDHLISEEQVAFADVETDQWFYSYVMEAREDGIVKGYEGGEFNPEAEVTNAEALKMVLEAAGEGTASGTPSDASAIGTWFEDYVVQAEALGLSDLGAWGEPSDRGTVAVWIAEVYGLEADYEPGTFPDVPANHSDADSFQAMYDYGIFTGDADTGTLRPDDSISRAEVSKAVNEAMDTAGSLTNLAQELEAAADELTSLEKKVELSSEVDSPSTNGGLLEILKNFFSSVFSF